MWPFGREREESGYPDNWQKLRSRVFRRDGWQCQSCGRAGGSKGDAELHAHHIQPKSKGGDHNADNLVTVCDRCHAAIHKDNRLLEVNQTGSSTRFGHGLVALTTIWWTFGLGNLLYEWIRRKGSKEGRSRRRKRKNGVRKFRRAARGGSNIPKHFNTKIGADGLPRLGKREGKIGFWQSRADRGRNERYGGCPKCGRPKLTVSWLKLEDGSKAKAVECESCSAIYDESGSNLSRVNSPEELDSGRSAVLRELFG